MTSVLRVTASQPEYGTGRWTPKTKRLWGRTMLNLVLTKAAMKKSQTQAASRYLSARQWDLKIECTWIGSRAMFLIKWSRGTTLVLSGQRTSQKARDPRIGDDLPFGWFGGDLGNVISHSSPTHSPDTTQQSCIHLTNDRAEVYKAIN